MDSMTCRPGQNRDDGSILVVDDSEDDLELTRLALLEAGCRRRVECAPDGEAALARLISSRPAPCLLLLDLRMPRVDGLEVLRRVRQVPALSGLRIVVFTSSSLEEDRQRAVELGCDLYLEKPIDFHASVKAARRVLEFVDG